MMIAKHELVDRVVMLSAVVDTTNDWELTHVTPSQRYWGLAHDHEPNFGSILGGWGSLGITLFGPVVTVETGSPPYEFTHTLATDVTPRRNGSQFHASTALDRFTPLNHPGGTPTLAPAWRYMMSQ